MEGKRRREMTWSECVQAIKSGKRSVHEVLPEIERLMSDGGPEADEKESSELQKESGFSVGKMYNRGRCEGNFHAFRLQYLEVPFSLWQDLLDPDGVDSAVWKVDKELDLFEEDLFPPLAEEGSRSKVPQHVSQQRASHLLLKEILEDDPCNDRSYPVYSCRASMDEWTLILHKLCLEQELTSDDYSRLLERISSADLADTVLFRVVPGMLVLDSACSEGKLSQELDQLLEIAFKKGSLPLHSRTASMRKIKEIRLSDCGFAGLLAEAKLRILC